MIIGANGRAFFRMLSRSVRTNKQPTGWIVLALVVLIGSYIIWYSAVRR